MDAEDKFLACRTKQFGVAKNNDDRWKVSISLRRLLVKTLVTNPGFGAGFSAQPRRCNQREQCKKNGQAREWSQKLLLLGGCGFHFGRKKQRPPKIGFGMAE